MAVSMKARGRSDSSKLTELFDAEGNLVQPESREDEEQNVKLQETVELLLAAGYFRARIKGLSPFDKVVGGMTWCIETCNIDVDVDLLFQENLTIGQKISLTEKIVVVLPKMKCPHRLEPHQIQGLDFIHIFPVVQWLVKRAMETRAERGDYIRAFSISQFDKHHATPQDLARKENAAKVGGVLHATHEEYGPKRRYRRQESAAAIRDEGDLVRCTLLEYGQRFGLSKSQQVQESQRAEKARAAAAAIGQRDAGSADETHAEEQRRIAALMSGMASADGVGSLLSASAIGDIVGMNASEIQRAAADYADKRAGLESEVREERLTGSQRHSRVMAALNKQMAQLQGKVEESEGKRVELEGEQREMQEKLSEVKQRSGAIDAELEKFAQLENSENKEVVEKLRGLVSLNESLKHQEQEFRASCKDELGRLEGVVETERSRAGEEGEDLERCAIIDKQFAADRDKMNRIRLLLAKKNREISVVQRNIDEVPSRAELSQYQRRFVELYNQVAATLKETKQFYTLYNTLDDTKLYLTKEINLLNSIHDNFEQAMASLDGKDQFLKQMEQIVDGIRQNKLKVEKKKQEEKMHRDKLNDSYLDLVDKQRLYFKTVKDFKEECRKNEILAAKMKTMKSS